MNRKLMLTAEFIIIFVLMPLIIFRFNSHAGRFVLPVIAAATLYTVFILGRDRGFRWKDKWKLPEQRISLLRILPLFAAGSVFIFLFVRLTEPSLLFAFPSEKPVMWTVVMLFYPMLSALPQEIMFRVFFFRRYGELFGDKALVPLSAAVFSLAHLFYGNPVAPVFSFFGGLIFAVTYSRTGSLTLTALEHALWGNMLFTIGAGAYFYHGTIS
ncbi:CPBP family intramembrane metalloprotease [Geovibrio thiophilus]|uniref:CPBP family intramembrane metalloprotease n=1 Tax=Geovibrio thiophilus TaxID=139438 RepID=A0A3R6AX87_9BACT|nr:type II CAAX endopeptidase family protein [Geovibrio thiophilus]QAR32557.1 CPBP family intramembrane metalloprotease [Geovibrio thiophilus]